MPAIYANVVSGTLTDSPLLIGATSANSSNFASLPTVTAPDFLWLTLDPLGTAGAPEIVKVTAHTAASTTVTITRAQQSTTARQHLVSTAWDHAFTKSDADDLPHRLLTTTGDLMYASAANTADRLALGSTGSLLDVVGGVPAWLAPGAASAVLKIVSGVPAWVAGAFTTWTPTVTQSGSVTVIANEATYFRLGRMITCWATLTVTGSGSSGNAVVVSLPVTAKAGYSVYSVTGEGELTQAETSGFAGLVRMATSTTFKLRDLNTTAGNVYLGESSSTYGAALANGDIISFHLTYEAATDA